MLKTFGIFERRKAENRELSDLVAELRAENKEQKEVIGRLRFHKSDEEVLMRWKEMVDG